MRRTEALQAVRLIKFRSVFDRHESSELNQAGAADRLRDTLWFPVFLVLELFLMHQRQIQSHLAFPHRARRAQSSGSTVTRIVRVDTAAIVGSIA